MAIADVQRQIVAVRSGETVPMNCPVGESQSNGREDAVQRVQGLIRTLKGASERRLNTKIRSRDTTFPWMVEWSPGLITRNALGQTSRTKYREARGHDAQAPVAEFGEKIMHMTSKNVSAPRVDAKFHDGMWAENEEMMSESSGVEWGDQSEDCEEAR